MIRMPPEDHLDASTWAALLGRWMDLAKASRALDGGDDGPWQRAAAPLITCQALTLALGEIHVLGVSERALALDQAEVLLQSTGADLEDAFSDQPPEVTQAWASAELALSGARRQFAWTIIWDGPEVLAMPAISGIPARASDEGAVAAMLPGTLALPGEPIAWWVGRDEPMLAMGVAGCRAIPLDRPLQVWRRFDGDGRVLEDRVCDVDDDTSDAIPLLVPRLAGGHRLEAPTVDAAWPPADPATMGDVPVPVRWDAAQWDDC